MEIITNHPYTFGIICFVLGLGIGAFAASWIITRNPNLLTRFFDNIDDSVDKATKMEKEAQNNLINSQAMKAAADAYTAAIAEGKKLLGK